MIDRTQPPPPGLPKDVVFPSYFETVLSNGLKVIVYERHDLPTVTVSVVSRTGAYFDGALPGRATLTAEMMTKGAGGRSATAVVEDIEFLGGSIGANAGWDSSSAGITILHRHLDAAMDILADVVRRPDFPADELERVREQRLASIMQRKSNPGSLAAMRFQRAVYGDVPYAFPAEGTEESVAACDTASLAACHAQAFTPGNCFVLAVGDVYPDRFVPVIERLFGDWDGGPPPTPIEHPLPVWDGIRVQIVDRPSAVQSAILVGHAGITRTHPDYITVTILNTLLGGYFGSRLNLNLREDKGFTYGAHSRFDARRFPGPFSAGADVRNDVTDAAVEEIVGEITRLVDAPVGADELAGVQRYVTGNFPIQIETPSQVAQRIITLELYGLDRNYYNTFNSAVMALTPERIHAVAREVLHPGRLVIAAAGKGALLRNTLARFGPVEVFSADGDPIPTPDA